MQGYITGLLHEIYVALQNDSKRLAAMGVRALIEHIMIDKIEDQGSFRKNVAKFHEKGFISLVQKKILLTILEAGHAAIHRSYNPSEEDLTTLIDVAESVIESIYVNDYNAKNLEKRIPPRKSKEDQETSSAKNESRKE